MCSPGSGYRGDNPYSDGPIESFEGIALSPAGSDQGETVIEEGSTSVEVSEILGVIAPA